MLGVVLLFLAVFLWWCWWTDVFSSFSFSSSSAPSSSSSGPVQDNLQALPLPPGPGRGLPLLGHLTLLRSDPRPQFAQWRQQYGDVFSFYMARRLVVVLNGYDTIREALVKHADVFSVRPNMFVTDFITRSGIAFNSGPSWKEQRKLTMEILRSLGMGKPRFTNTVLLEVQQLIQAIRDLQGQPTDLSQVIGVSMSNNICNVVFGRRFEYDSASFLRYLQLMRDNLQLLRSTNLLNYLPWLTYLPGDLFGAKKVLENVAEMERCFLIPQIQAHIERENSREQVRSADENKIDSNDDDHGRDEKGADDDDDGPVDFISAYLSHLKRDQAGGKLTASLNVNLDNLEWTVSDLFVAGTETLTTALLWVLLYLIHYPRVQRACFHEIRDILGLTSPPGAHHRKELTYVEATIMETMRIADIGALGLQHGATRDVVFRGYRIPQNVILVPYLHTALNDQTTWGDPECFRPERFLDPETGVLVKRDEFIPFSIGRRACPGESIARLELFLYVTSLIQHFRFLPEIPGMLPSLEGVMEFTHTPHPFRIRAVPRQSSEDD